MGQSGDPHGTAESLTATEHSEIMAPRWRAEGVLALRQPIAATHAGLYGEAHQRERCPVARRQRVVGVLSSRSAVGATEARPGMNSRSLSIRSHFLKWRARRLQEEEFRQWVRQGRSTPPPHPVKARALRRCAKELRLRVFVETGTYHGDMVAAMEHEFDQIYSVELGDDLFERARRRFESVPHVKLMRGDSRERLAEIVSELTQAALFWLDGHYSGGVTARSNVDTPIREELDHILKAPDMGHVIIIDDARCFGTDPAYPTPKELRAFVLARRDTVEITEVADSFRIVPRR